MSASLRIEFVHPQKTVHLVAIGEVDAVPVDHRTAAQQVPDGGQIAHREGVVGPDAPESLRAWCRRRLGLGERGLVLVVDSPAIGSRVGAV